MIQEPFNTDIKIVVQRLNSSIQFGLTNEEAERRIQEYGVNEIPEKKKKSRWKILIDQFIDPIILILALATLFTFLFSPDLLETISILTVILITVTIGFIMELQGIRSLEALRKMGHTQSTVLRDGKIQMIPSILLVPGDIILIETGDIVSADARLISVENLSIKEASLTGESTPVKKDLRILAKNTPLPERSNMIFKGTSIIKGSAKAIITYTGFYTQLGKIQQMGIDIKEQRTPLEKKLNQLSKWLIWLTLLFAILIFFTGYLRGMDIIVILKTAIALAVAAIPEGLPIVATIALARGMLKLSKRKVIIKRMEAVETLGATNIICTDKTGTLTEDKMQVHTIILEDKLLSKIQNEEHHFFDSLLKKKSFNTIIMASVLCNNVALDVMNKKSDSIELALVQFAEKLKLNLKDIKDHNPEELEIPFDSNSKLMITMNQNVITGTTIYVKGAFESLVKYCDTILRNDAIQEFTNKKEWFDKVNKLASQGLRVLGFAYKDVTTSPVKEDLLSNLTFIGIIGFLDPAREDVKATIKVYKDAGIKVVMLTGDHPGTAKKIAEEVGLLTKKSVTDGIIHGKDLQLIDEPNDATKEQLLNTSVFARLTPEQKLKIIAFYQKNNNIVGMFGDGINDIPALRKADIGIAMGIRGTQAAREAADIILKNDRFTAMELAIKQGRAIFDHIRQFVVYLLSCNLAEVVSVGLAALLNLPAPLLPLQILFLNLVTDIFPALALGMGKGEVDIMNRPPRKANEPIMTPKLWSSTIIFGLCITAAVIGITAYSHFVLKVSPSEINNMAFFTLLLAQLFNVFNMSKTEVSFFSNEVIKNPWVWGAFIISIIITVGAYLVTPISNALHLTNLSTEQFGWVVIFALGALVLSQLMKRLGFTF